MTRSSRSGQTAWWAAMLAVLLFTNASIKATTMQAASAASPALAGRTVTGGMAGMAEMAGMNGAPAAAGKKAILCPFCADAAQAAILTFSPPIRSSDKTACVEVAETAAVSPRSSRARRPRVRDPPLS